MNITTTRFIRNAARLSYMLGVASLIVGLILSVTYHPASAQGLGNCGNGFIAKVESAPFTYSGTQIITSVYVKAGSETQSGGACTLITTNGSNGCYNVVGLGTTSVTVTNVTTSSSCKAISHIEVYSNPDQPTATPVTPSATPVTPTSTTVPSFTPTATLQPSATPTSTTAPSSTPTSTPVVPSATPTATMKPDDPTATPVTPTATDVPQDPTATPFIPGITPTATTPPVDPTATVVPVDPTPTTVPEASSTPGTEPTDIPTLPAPAPQSTVVRGQPPALIPVTGADFSTTVPQTVALQSLFVNLGIGLLGLGLVLTGVSNRTKK